jgi:hypothetical protein
MHNKVDFDKRKKICYLFAIFNAHNQGLFIAVVPDNVFFTHKELKL